MIFPLWDKNEEWGITKQIKVQYVGKKKKKKKKKFSSGIK